MLYPHPLGQYAQLLDRRTQNYAQNSYHERFNRTYQEEVLDSYLFDCVEEVCNITEHWLKDYNTIHPDDALQGLPLRQFA
jgi:transposase InsO family protein